MFGAKKTASVGNVESALAPCDGAAMRALECLEIVMDRFGLGPLRWGGFWGRGVQFLGVGRVFQRGLVHF